MAVHIVRLGTPRSRKEGLRLGTVRRLPRGVRKTDYAKRDYFDVWLPELAPSVKLLSTVRPGAITDAQWKQFVARYQREMRVPAIQRVLQLLATLSRQTDFSVGCYCADETRCHRSVLRTLLKQHGAVMARSKT